MGAYESFASVYDLFMNDVDYDGWTDYIEEIWKKFGLTPGLVCELGCGTGNITLRLAERGYDMIAVDLSAEMLSEAEKKAEEKNINALFLMQDMREFELYGTVSSVLCLCDSLNYITDPEELKQVFCLVNNYLDPGGLFLFDINTVHKYRDVLGDTTIAEDREEASFIWENSYDPESRINTYELAVFLPREDGLYEKCEELHCQRGYEKAEIEKLLKEAGMEIEGVYEAYTDKPASKDSERLLFIAKEHGKQIEK